MRDCSYTHTCATQSTWKHFSGTTDYKGKLINVCTGLYIMQSNLFRSMMNLLLPILWKQFLLIKQLQCFHSYSIQMTPAEIGQSGGISLIVGVSSWQVYQTVKTRNSTTFIILAAQTRLLGLNGGGIQIYVNLIFHYQADCIQIVKPIVDELIMLERDGILLYDAFLRKEVLAFCPVLCLICDNPRASEIVNHMGPGSRMFCRMCMVWDAFTLCDYSTSSTSG